MEQAANKKIVIIGSGFSGTSAAINLLKDAVQPLDIVLLETDEQSRCGGPAFSAHTAPPELATNIPVEQMSARPELREDFLDWLEKRADRTEWPQELQSQHFKKGDKAPRQLFQLYMKDTLQEAEQTSAHGKLHMLTGTAAGLDETASGVSITLKDGSVINADMAIVATGNPTSKLPPFIQPHAGEPTLIRDLYTPEGLSAKSAIPKNEDVWVYGAGLSGYDAVVTLLKQGHTGKIYVSSRNGHEHFVPTGAAKQKLSYERAPAFMFATSLEATEAAITEEMTRRIAEGYSTQEVMVAWKPYIKELLVKFPQEQVQAELKKHQSLIGTLALAAHPDVAAVIQQAKDSGQLQVIAGNTQSLTHSAGGWEIKLDSQAEAYKAGHVMCCFGREADRNPLWQDIYNKQLAAPHFTGIGIATGEHGELVNASGTQSGRILAVGSIRAGDTMARSGTMAPIAGTVPVLRHQARDTAQAALHTLQKETPAPKQELPKLSLQSSHLTLPPQHRQALMDGLTQIASSNWLDISGGDTWGDKNLRKAAISMTPNWTGDVLITSSATQGLSLALEHVGRGKTLALQKPCFFGVMRIAEKLGMDIKYWETPQELASLGHVDGILLTSNYVPPACHSLSDGQKQEIAAVAKQHNALLIEDNVYDPLWRDTAPKPIAYDADKTIRIGSFSKLIGNQFRLGFIRAEGDLLKELRSEKITADLFTNPMSQRIAAAGLTDELLASLRDTFKARADLLRTALVHAFEGPFSAKVSTPEGGSYIQLELPENTDIAALVKQCADKGLQIDENKHSYADTQNRPYIRLHYGAIEEKDIPRAVAILQSAFKDKYVPGHAPDAPDSKRALGR